MYFSAHFKYIVSNSMEHPICPPSFGGEKGIMSSEDICTISCVTSIKAYLSPLSTTYLLPMNNLHSACHKPAVRLERKRAPSRPFLSGCSLPRLTGPQKHGIKRFHSLVRLVQVRDSLMGFFYTFVKAPETAIETKCYSFTSQ